MSFSKNERRLLILLVIVVVLGLGFSLFILPQMKMLSARQIELLDKQAQKFEMEQSFVGYEDASRQLEEALQNAQAGDKRFYSAMTSYEVDMLTYSMLTPYAITIKDMNISAPEEVSLALHMKNSGEISRSALGRQLDSALRTDVLEEQPPATEADTEPSLLLRTATVHFTAAYSNLKSFLDSVTVNGQAVYVSACEVNEINLGQAEGTLEIRFYQL